MGIAYLACLPANVLVGQGLLRVFLGFRCPLYGHLLPKVGQLLLLLFLSQRFDLPYTIIVSNNQIPNTIQLCKT